MSMARFLSLAVLVFAAVSLRGAERPVFAEEPKWDERYFVEAYQLMSYRDGVLALGPGLHFLTSGSKMTEPFPVKGVHDVTSIAKAGESVLFLGIGSDGEFVMAGEEPGKEIGLIPLPREVEKPGPVAPNGPIFPVLLSSSGLKAVTVEQTVWWLEGETWKNRKLPKVPKFYKEFEPEGLGGRRYLLGHTMFVGWDQGEWGGMMASIDLAAENPEWVHLSGKKRDDDSGIPENQPVRKILSTDGKSLWVGTGLAHLSGTWSGLSRRGADGRWKTLISTEFDEVSGPLSLPEGVAMATIAADARGRVHLLGTGAGIFRVEEKSLVQVLDYSFLLSHETDSHVVGCYPLDMAVGKQGDFFVSTNAFGILAFKKEGEEWKGRQILVKQEN